MITIDLKNNQYYLNKKGAAPIYLDAGLGSLIEDFLPDKSSTIHRGSDFNAPLHAPKVVLQAHQQYVAAGADILTTETFRGFQRTGEKAQILDAALKAARQAITSTTKNCAIAISLGPVGDTENPCQTPDNQTLQKEHAQNIRIIQKQLDRLPANSKLTVFLLPETIPTLREMKIIAALAQEAAIPFLSTFKIDDHGRILDGNTINHAVSAILKPYRFCLGLGVNCCSVEGAQKAVPILSNRIKNDARLSGKQIVAYPNGYQSSKSYGDEAACCPHSVSKRLTPAALSNALHDLLEKGATAIGGCCGAGPNHTKAYVGQENASQLLYLYNQQKTYGSF